MTQTFIGYKPGVGPVLKCLKHDGDDPLTLANNAYDRYIFNSENQDLSYVYTQNPFEISWNSSNALPASFDFYPTSAGPTISGSSSTSSTAFHTIHAFYRATNMLPGIGYPPLMEVRSKNLQTGRFSASYWRRTQWGQSGAPYEVEAYQYEYQIMRVSSYIGDTSQQTLPNTYNGQLYNSFSRIPIGEWIVPSPGNWVYSDGRGWKTDFFNIWDLPANNAPMRSYSYAPGLLSLQADSSGFVLSRPGFDIYSTSPFSKIIDSNKAPSLCIMADVINGLANANQVTLTPPPGIILSESAVLDFMVRVSGAQWQVPGLITDTSALGVRGLEYQIVNNSIVVYNNGGDTLDFRYVVFNTDSSGTSTGGSQVMFSANDGTQDYFQIKKPGTSDPASRPNDILFDTRFPSFQIINQGFIPLSSFSEASAMEKLTLGNVKATINFENHGFIPYLKFAIVFPNCCTTPYYNRGTFSGNSASMSNRSGVARMVNDNSVSFWLSPGNWSFMDSDGTRGGVPDPIGIRYYIFGITPK